MVLKLRFSEKATQIWSYLSLRWEDKSTFVWPSQKILFFFLLFSGSQKANKRITGAHEWTEDYIRENKSTVQGALETMMLCLRPYSEVIANFASR